MEILTAVVQGVLVGGLYTATGIGLSLVFGVLRIVNLAHGQFVVAGAFLSFAITTRVGVDPLVSLPLVALIGAAAGWGLHRGLLDRLARQGSSQPLVATFGIALLLQAILAQMFTYDARSIPAPYADAGVTVAGITVQLIYLITLALSVVIAVAIHLVLQQTRWGAAVRAAGKQPDVAALVGVDVKSLHAGVFALASALAVVGGVMVGLTVSFTPASGVSYLVLGFAVAVMGGIGNMLGTLVAAMSLGMVQSLSTLVIGGGYRDLVAYALFLAVLALRPQGLGQRVSLA